MLELEAVVQLLGNKMLHARAGLEYARQSAYESLAQYWQGRIDILGELMRELAELDA